MGTNGLATTDTLRVYEDILHTIGNTSLVRLGRLGRGLPCSLYANVEFFNPGGSVKDRIALNIIDDAERSGRLKPGGLVVEATSGNTSVGLARLMSNAGEKLPLLLDDPLVQFDRNRQMQALEYLRQLAEDTQVFLFTKDEETMKWYEGRCSSVTQHKLHSLEAN